MENANPNIARVQHVAKASSDQLLMKFAEVGSEPKDKSSANDLRLAKLAERSQARKECCSSGGSGNGNGGGALAERKTLLPAATTANKPMALFRTLGMSKARIRAREIKNKSIIIALEKTWRKTVEGALRVVLMEKHYNRHKRLTKDNLYYY